ncbi:hypothetical protein [Sphingomonas sp. dw_22]|uniref:hypothetical protein n=1 Tax=Sphingomonas sp. dw_22 TaxID=2721175 RepID=UPI001BD58A36|nr:hypothetical protein [Sphingomonas sp. dw_22]
MFDAGHIGSDCISSEPNNDRPSRRQYTLKGVEADTIRLMRDAANKEGMKIGSWVSLRMKEAAEKALSERDTAINPNPSAPIINQGAEPELIHHICLLITSQREEAEARFLKLERELHEITSSQRTILSNLLAAR